MSLTINRFSDPMLNEGSCLSQSSNVNHRTTLVALRSLSLVEDAFEKNTSLNRDLVLRDIINSQGEPFYGAAHVLANDSIYDAMHIFVAALDKYKFLDSLKKSINGFRELVSYTKYLTEDRVVEKLVEIIERLDVQKESEEGVSLEITEYCLEKLHKIHREWGGHGLTEEEILNWQSISEKRPFEKVQFLFKGLTTIRRKICDISAEESNAYPYKEESIQNLKACLNILNKCLKGNLRTLDLEMKNKLFRLNLDMPEFLEYLENEIQEARKPRQNILNVLSERELGSKDVLRAGSQPSLMILEEAKDSIFTPRFSDQLPMQNRENNLEEIRRIIDILQKYLKGFKDWQAAGYSASPERMLEVESAITHIQQELNQFYNLEMDLENPDT